MPALNTAHDDPSATHWFDLADLERIERRGGPAEVIDYIVEAIVGACHHCYLESDGRLAMALVFSPRLYAYIGARAKIDGSVDITFQSFFKSETAAVPVYVRSPAPGDLRVTCVMYAALERLREDDEVLHGITMAAAMRNLGLSAEDFDR